MKHTLRLTLAAACAVLAAAPALAQDIYVLKDIVLESFYELSSSFLKQTNSSILHY